MLRVLAVFIRSFYRITNLLMQVMSLQEIRNQNSVHFYYGP